MRRAFYALLCTFAVFLLMGQSVTWNTAYENTPAGGDPVSEGDDRLRELKTSVRERAQAEMDWWTGGPGGDTGRLNLGAARPFYQDAAPTQLIEQDASGDQALDNGRLWLDKDGADGVDDTADDGMLRYRNEDNTAWEFVTVDTSNLPLVFGNNLLRNSSFETILDTTDTATAPLNWTKVNPVTFTYGTAVAEGGGRHVILNESGVGGSSQSIYQTVGGLKASTEYFVVARANATTAADTCTLVTTDASVNISETTLTTAAWEDLSGTITTDATPTDVTVSLIPNGVSDVCAFDHVGFYELRPTVPIGSAQDLWYYELLSGSVTNAAPDTLALNDAIIAPLNNCIVHVLVTGYGTHSGAQTTEQIEIEIGGTPVVEGFYESSTVTLQTVAVSLQHVFATVAGTSYDISVTISTDSGQILYEHQVLITMDCPGN